MSKRKSSFCANNPGWINHNFKLLASAVAVKSNAEHSKIIDSPPVVFNTIQRFLHNELSLKGIWIMAKKEVKTDLWVARQLDDSQIKYDAQGSNVKEINDALQSASKRGTGKVGYPEYVAVVKDFVIVNVY